MSYSEEQQEEMRQSGRMVEECGECGERYLSLYPIEECFEHVDLEGVS